MTNGAGVERDLVWLRPGGGKGVANGRVRILVASESSIAVDDLWRALLERQGLADVLDLLAGSGLVGLGSFAVAVSEANERTRLLVRGSGRAAASMGQDVTTIEPHGAETWVERVIDRATHVGLWLDPASPAPVGDDVSVPMSDLVRMLSGIAPAEAMWWATGDRGTVAAVPEEPAAQTDAKRSALAAGRSRPAVPLDAAVAPSMASGDTAADIHIAAAQASDGSRDDAVPAAPTAVASEPLTVDEDSTRVAGGDSPDEPASDIPASSSSGVIDAVPRAKPPVSGAAAGGGEDAGATIVRPRSSRAADRPATATPAVDLLSDPATPQLVQASMCVRRHPNPPHAVRCSACGDELGDVLEMVQRPSLGSLRFSDGRVCELDSPVIIGTEPLAPSDLSGINHQTVSVVECDRVAAAHAVIRLEGWHVYVEDLHTPDGTEVTLPDRAPVRIRPEDPMLLEGGSRIDLAGQYSFEFETIF